MTRGSVEGERPWRERAAAGDAGDASFGKHMCGDDRTCRRRRRLAPPSSPSPSGVPAWEERALSTAAAAEAIGARRATASSAWRTGGGMFCSRSRKLATSGVDAYCELESVCCRNWFRPTRRDSITCAARGIGSCGACVLAEVCTIAGARAYLRSHATKELLRRHLRRAAACVAKLRPQLLPLLVPPKHLPLRCSLLHRHDVHGEGAVTAGEHTQGDHGWARAAVRGVALVVWIRRVEGGQLRSIHSGHGVRRDLDPEVFQLWIFTDVCRFEEPTRRRRCAAANDAL